MNHPRRFGKSQRMAIYLNSDGKCQLAKRRSRSVFHADHIVPWSKGGPTTLSNAQALCSSCNLSKSSTMTVPYQNHLPPGFILRDWQEEFVNRFYASALHIENLQRKFKRLSFMLFLDAANHWRRRL